MAERLVQRRTTRARSARVATLAVLAVVAAVAALLPAGAGAENGLGDRIYWTNEGGSLRAGNLDGSGVAATLYGGENSPCGVALDPAAGKMYWANFSDPGEIRVGNLDGTGAASTLFTDPGFLCGVAVDRSAGKIYWANFGANAIRVANLDGSGAPATLFQEVQESGPSGVAIDPSAGTIYWTNQLSDELRVGNLDGSGSASTLFGPADAGDNPIGLALDPVAGKVYWSDLAVLDSGEVRVGNLNGTGASALYTGLDAAAGIALDAASGKLYWGSWGTGTIRRGSVDGSVAPVTLFLGESLPLFPVLLRAPEPGGQLPAVTAGVGNALNCSLGSWKPDALGAYLFRAPSTFAYQWQLDGTDIPGATAASFTYSEAGDYTCRVTATNLAGSFPQTSAASTITLLDLGAYYDSNTNRVFDPGEASLAGWKVQLGSTAYLTPKFVTVNPGVYQVTAAAAGGNANWLPTSPASVQVSALAGDRTPVTFGNVCLGKGGVLGAGSWTNKQGIARATDDLPALVALNLRNANGTHFDPANYTAFANWLPKTSSTNMASSLSGQLAVMKLNVLNGIIGGGSLIAAPGTTSKNAAGFATVNAVMDEANAELGLHGLTTSGSAFRAYQTALKDVLSNAIANKTFVQSAPCAFSFG